jgi:hypothetical protein
MQTNTGLEEISPSGSTAEIVQRTRGDDELDALDIGRVAGVKIDVEGHEPDVIRGLERTLRRDQPVVFWEAFRQTDADRSVQLLREMGYRNFHHLARVRGLRGFLRALRDAPGGRTQLVPLESCTDFSGLNVASIGDLRAS